MQRETSERKNWTRLKKATEGKKRWVETKNNNNNDCSGAALRQLVRAASILDWLHILKSSMEVLFMRCGSKIAAEIGIPVHVRVCAPGIVANGVFLGIQQKTIAMTKTMTTTTIFWYSIRYTSMCEYVVGNGHMGLRSPELDWTTSHSTHTMSDGSRKMYYTHANPKWRKEKTNYNTDRRHTESHSLIQHPVDGTTLSL